MGKTLYIFGGIQRAGWFVGALCPRAVALMWLLVFTVPYAGHGQASSLDSLNYQLEMARTDSNRVEILIGLSSEHAKSNLSLSLQYAQRALAIGESSKNPRIESRALLNIGTICFQQGMYELSVGFFYKNLTISRATNNNESVANTLTNIGAIHLQLKNLDQAKEHFIEALEAFRLLSERRGDTVPPYQLVTIYNNLGIVSENKMEYNEAIGYYQQGIGLAHSGELADDILAMLFNNMGSCYLKMGRRTQALNAMREALHLRRHNNDLQGEAMSCRMLAIYFTETNHPDSALFYMRRGLQFATSVGSIPILASLSERLYDFFTTQKQPDSALFYHIQFKEFSDRLNSEKTLQELRVQELTAQFLEEQKIHELEQLKQRQRFLFVAIVLVLVVVILGLLYIVSQSRNRRLILRNTNMELARKNAELERETLAQELEVKNKEFAANVMYQISKNELIGNIAERLMKNSHNFRKENQELIRGILKDLETLQEETVWDEFETRFHQVHNQFYDQLKLVNPELSPNDRRLCAFLRLNMSTKEISSITGQSLRSIEVARTRLRRKLNLTNSDVGLVEFLANL